MEDLILATSFVNKLFPGLGDKLQSLMNQAAEPQELIREPQELISDDLLGSFLSDCKVRGLQKRTMESYKSVVKDFLEQYPDPRNVTQVELRQILKIYKNRGIKTATQKRHFAALNTFYRYLIFEGIVSSNPIPSFRERYLNVKNYDSETRRLIFLDEVKAILNSFNEILDYTIIFVLAKTGLRRGELLSLNIQDIDFKQRIIHVPQKAKRSRNVAFIDDELETVMRTYLKWRSSINSTSSSLFIGKNGYPVHKDYPGYILVQSAHKLGIHNPKGPLHERITVHCFRHFFTTYLHRAGMNEEYIKWVRGDALQEAWQIYNHIDLEEVRREYEACIPSLLDMVHMNSLDMPLPSRGSARPPRT